MNVFFLLHYEHIRDYLDFRLYTNILFQSGFHALLCFSAFTRSHWQILSRTLGLIYSMQMIRSCSSISHIDISPIDNLVHCMDHIISWILQNVPQLRFKMEVVIIGANARRQKECMNLDVSFKFSDSDLNFFLA